MRAFVIRRWFLILLGAALGLGIWWSEPLRPLAGSVLLRQSLLVSVMFLMALPLRAAVMWDAVRRPGAVVWGCLANALLVPLLAWGLCGAVLLAWPGFRRELRMGILVAATVPCTLASAAVWTRRAGGNDAAALLVTLVTNLLCFLITPGWLWLMVGRMPDFHPRDMAVQLGLLVVLPVLAAQILRRLGALEAWAADHQTLLGVWAQCGVLLMIFLGAIQTGNRLADDSSGGLWTNLAVMMAIVMATHLGVLFAVLRTGPGLGLSRADATAAALSGSQKTAMVGLEVAVQLGVSVLPMVAYHVGQLLADTAIADRLRDQDRAGGDPPPSLADD